jgi:hypothetical protein
VYKHKKGKSDFDSASSLQRMVLIDAWMIDVYVGGPTVRTSAGALNPKHFDA